MGVSLEMSSRGNCRWGEGGFGVGMCAQGFRRMANLQIPRNSWGSFLGIRGILGFSLAARMFGAEFGEIAGFSESKRETGGSEMPNSGILGDRTRTGEMAGRRNVGFSEKRSDK